MTTPKLLRAFALALPLLLALGCDDDDNAGGPDATLKVEATVAGNGGIVVVTDGGVGVTGADVTLNGAAGVAGATAGEYTVTLAPPVAAGGALTLDVSDGDAAVQGTGTVPEAPVITAPLDGADVAGGADVEVTWTSTADPDGWLLVATSGGSTVTAETADGALRTLTIAGASLAAGDWVVNLYAVDDGVVTGDVEAGSTMEVRAAATTSPTISVVAPVTVTGNDMGDQDQSIRIEQGGAVVDGATVTVNGEAAAQAGAGSPYTVTLAVPLATGDDITLDISFGTVGIQGTGTLPEGPVVTAPADGANFAITVPINVTWTSTTDPDRFVVRIDTGQPAPVEFEVAGTARAFTIPAGGLPAGTWTIAVHAYNDGVFTGPLDAASSMNIRGQGTAHPDVTINP